jgi:hypothetical protein
VKYAWLDLQRPAYPLPALCRALSVSQSGYHSWKRGARANRKRLTDGQLLTLIRMIHAELKGAYGSPRMADEIRSSGFPARERRLARLMCENSIRAGQSQAALQGHDGFETQAACRAQPARQAVRSGRAESALHVGHHVYLDGWTRRISGSRAHANTFTEPSVDSERTDSGEQRTRALIRRAVLRPCDVSIPINFASNRQEFLTTTEPIRQHFAFKRHLQCASLYPGRPSDASAIHPLMASAHATGYRPKA